MYIFKIVILICLIINLYKMITSKNTSKAYDYLFNSFGLFILLLIKKI